MVLLSSSIYRTAEIKCARFLFACVAMLLHLPSLFKSTITANTHCRLWILNEAGTAVITFAHTDHCNTEWGIYHNTVRTHDSQTHIMLYVVLFSSNYKQLRKMHSVVVITWVLHYSFTDVKYIHYHFIKMEHVMQGTKTISYVVQYFEVFIYFLLCGIMIWKQFQRKFWSKK